MFKAENIALLFKKNSVRLLSVLSQRPMTSDFEGFLSQSLSITFFKYLNYWERVSISLF